MGNVEVCRQSWTADQFDGEGEMTFDPENLILKKTITKDCENETVDGIKVCISKGHNMEFTCKYSLKAQLVDNNYDVTGHDTNIKEEGEGSLNYKLTVLDSENIKIGDTVQVDVEAVNEGLVFHTLQDCTVKKKFADADGDEETQQVSILNWHEIDNNLVTYCPNYLGASIVTKSSTSKATFSWKAFKWSTSQEEGNDAEDQLIECTIKLSQHDPMVEIPRSEDENSKLAKFANNAGFNDRIILGIVDTTEGTYINLRGNQAVAQQCAEGEEGCSEVIRSKPAEGVWNNWSPAEPNNHDGVEDYSEMVVNVDDENDNYGKWNDIKGGDEENAEENNVVCQKPDYLCVDL